MGALANGLDQLQDRLPRPHVSLAHSMGGAIALAAISQGRRAIIHCVRAVVFGGECDNARIRIGGGVERAHYIAGFVTAVIACGAECHRHKMTSAIKRVLVF
jgi:pimeloyl-ACP methyl ester carboxylesterase